MAPKLTYNEALELIQAKGYPVDGDPAFCGASPETIGVDNGDEMYVYNPTTGRMEAMTEDGSSFYWYESERDWDQY